MWRNILLTIIILILSVGVLYVTIFELDPMGEQKYVAYLAFGVSVMLGIWSLMTLVCFFGAEIISGHKLGNRSFLIATRRGFLLGLLSISLLTLQFLSLLSATEAVLLVLFFAMIEWIFLTGKYY